MKKLIFLFFVFIYFLGNSQQYVKDRFSGYTTVKSQYFKTAKDLTSYLPAGFSKTGNTDYTSYIQKGINENAAVIMPDFPVLVNESGLNLKSNQKILFQKNSKLIMKPNAKDRNGILNLFNIQNVDIYYPNLVGDKHKHLSTAGEWGMGIYILSSSDINIIGSNIQSCWGDGICIGGRNNISSSHITIKNSILNDHRRNGITIGGVTNLTIENAYIANTSGTNPQAGIDIEPDSNNYDIQNIKLTNIETKNNGNYGIIVSPGNMVGKKQKDISIAINNFKDNGSKIGLGMAVTRDKPSVGLPMLGGNISVSNFSSQNNSTGKFRSFKGASHKVNINLDFGKTGAASKSVTNYGQKLKNNNETITLK
ncbi:Right handed beta helix region [Chryseobacterium sp. RU37D]|uniref:right-handed parallel beta-helix repeat-containing protein n=1 Tax=Chryseobacterium sp. RU37D TaxID=1907397 RepID=UPI0009562406|nr:right-handed parallel beta-helix repeat-containing protein [Chryseobacterium sp. RU37D]SIQ58768.1 Right handed beta helix region [Chryseobacterium sp. RU37D]